MIASKLNQEKVHPMIMKHFRYLEANPHNYTTYEALPTASLFCVVGNCVDQDMLIIYIKLDEEQNARLLDEDRKHTAASMMDGKLWGIEPDTEVIWLD